MTTALAIELAERGVVPLTGLRWGVRRLLTQRLREAAEGPGVEAFARTLVDGPIAVSTDKANEQHYEVPAELFQIVLGPRLKYSGAYWLEDGQDVLELGCGWGSLTLYMARAYPASRITAVSNSATQRRFIEARAPANVRVITADINELELEGRFDHVVSVEMFEHMRNHRELLRRVRGWMRPDARLFVHVFCHRRHAYAFETEGADNWMGRHFFTGGIMPSFDLLPTFDEHLEVEDRWEVDGTHYARTARAWRERLERGRDDAMRVLRATYGAEAPRWFHRWRLFFLGCEELFGYRNGTEWLVAHYRFAPKA